MVIKAQDIEKKENNMEEVLLSVDDLHVWFELRGFGFGRAGYV